MESCGLGQRGIIDHIDADFATNEPGHDIGIAAPGFETLGPHPIRVVESKFGHATQQVVSFALEPSPGCEHRADAGAQAVNQPKQCQSEDNGSQ